MTHSKRLHFIDLFRGFAVLGMIATHVLDLFTHSSLRSQTLFDLLFGLTGYVAVAFTFCAGLSFCYAIESKDPKKLLKRILFILLCAYWQNAFVNRYALMLQGNLEELLRFFQIDILHIIAYSMLLSMILWRIIPESYKITSFILIGIFIFFSTPFIWNLHLENSWPLPIALFFANYQFVKFAFFPYGAYFFTGLILGLLLKKSDPAWLISRTLIFSILVYALVQLAKLIPFTYPGWNLTWYASPGHSLWRISGVVFTFCLFYYLEKTIKKSPKLSSFLTLGGQESLSIYLIHNLVLFGSYFWKGLGEIYYQQFQYGIVTLLFILTSLFCFALAYFWQKIKTENPQRASLLTKSYFVVYILVVFYFSFRSL